MTDGLLLRTVIRSAVLVSIVSSGLACTTEPAESPDSGVTVTIDTGVSTALDAQQPGQDAASAPDAGFAAPDAEAPTPDAGFVEPQALVEVSGKLLDLQNYLSRQGTGGGGGGGGGVGMNPGLGGNGGAGGAGYCIVYSY